MHFESTKLGRFPESRSDPIQDTLALVLAGGEGSRLQPLTRWRCKPSVPFGGKYRLIDFTLSNCINSGIRHIGVLVQYKSQLLISHLQKGWNIFHPEFNEFLEVLPAQQNNGKNWYSGTADAIYQNIDLIKRHNPKYVLIVAGDHIYKADYRRMIDYHVESNAALSIGCVEVPLADAGSFGIVETDDQFQLTGFVEKPAHPEANCSIPDCALASMGIYVFSTEFLIDLLEKDAESSDSSHDFGADIIPGCIQDYKVMAYPFSQAQEDHYWKDVGTLDAYYRSNLDLVAVNPKIDLYDPGWPIWNVQDQLPPAKFIFKEKNRFGYAADSLVSAGCIVAGAAIEASLLHSGVHVDERTVIKNSIILPDARIGKACKIQNAIIEECCHIPDNTRIGFDLHLDSERFHVTDKGITVVCADMLKPDRTGKQTATLTPEAA